MKIGSTIQPPVAFSSRPGARNATSRVVSVFQQPNRHGNTTESVSETVKKVKNPSYHTDYYSPSMHREGQQPEQFPVPHKKTGPLQQKAIDFYNITAAINNYSGEGELIGVDTYA